MQLQLALTYASRSGNGVIADRINDIICKRESLAPLSDDNFSCDEDEEESRNLLHSSVTPLQQKQERISSNSFRLLKKLSSSYGRSSSFKKTAAAKNQTYQQDDEDDVLSDDSCGTRNEAPSGSHDHEATPIYENNTLQLYDDNEDTNSYTQEKTKDSVTISKSIKPSLGKTATCI